MSQNPNQITGFISSSLYDPSTLNLSDGSQITSIGSYGATNGLPVPILKVNGPNNQYYAQFDGTQAHKVALSGWEAWSAFTVFVVFRADSLDQTNNANFPYDRRTFLSICDPSTSGSGGEFAVFTNARQGSTVGVNNNGYGWQATSYPYATDQWHAYCFVYGADNGTKVRAYKAYNLNGSGDVSDLQWLRFNALLVGTDRTYIGATRGWKGGIGYVAAFNRALADNERIEATQYLVERFAVSPRSIKISGTTARTGRHVYVQVKDVQDKPVDVTGINGQLTLKRNGVSSNVTPAWDNANYWTSGVAIHVDPPIAADETVTVTVPDNAINTNAGICESIADMPVANKVGQTLIPRALPNNRTLGIGFNINSAGGSFWEMFTFRKNLISMGGPEYNPTIYGNTYDGNGYPTPLYTNFWAGISSPPSPDPSKIYPKIRYGKYCLDWVGDSEWAIERHPSETNTTITALTNEAYNSGNRHRRYFQVSGTYPSPTMVLRCTNQGQSRSVSALKLYWCEDVTDPDNVPWFDAAAVEKLRGAKYIRFMDSFTNTNFANAITPDDLTPIDYAWPAMRGTLRTVPLPSITSIMPWSGGSPLNPTARQFYVVTFSSPHGLTNGAPFTVRRPGNSPINVACSDGRVDNMQGWSLGGYPINSTQVVVGVWTGEFGRQSVKSGTGFTNALNDVAAFRNPVGGLPPEYGAKLVTEAEVPVMWVSVPETLNESGLRALIQRICTHLGQGIKLAVEPSNEVWNPTFTSYGNQTTSGYFNGLTAEGTGDSSPGYCLLWGQQYDICKSEWIAQGRSEADFIGVVGSAYGNLAFTQGCVQYLLGANRGSQVGYFTFAPYTYANNFRMSTLPWSTYTAEEIMDTYEWIFSADIVPRFMPQHLPFVDLLPNAKLVCYEDGFAYMGVSPNDLAVEDDQNLALAYHPLNYWLWAKKYNDLMNLGFEGVAIYGWHNNIGREFSGFGNSIYGVYHGLLQQWGYGLGANGTPNNLTAILDNAGKPKNPGNLLNVASVRGQFVKDWNSSLVTPPPLTPTIGRVYKKRKDLRNRVSRFLGVPRAY